MPMNFPLSHFVALFIILISRCHVAMKFNTGQPKIIVDNNNNNNNISDNEQVRRFTLFSLVHRADIVQRYNIIINPFNM